MTVRRAGSGGTHGSRPTGYGGHPGRTEASAPTRQNRNRAKWDVGDAVPYTLCHCEERSDAAIRSPQPEKTDSHTSDIGHWFGMTARRAGNGGTHGSRPTRCGGHPGRTGSSAPAKQNRNRAKWDGGDAVPYEITRGMCAMGGQRRPPLQGRTGAVRNGTSRTPSPTKSQGVCAMGGQRRPPLQRDGGDGVPYE